MKIINDNNMNVRIKDDRRIHVLEMGRSNNNMGNYEHKYNIYNNTFKTYIYINERDFIICK